MITFKELKRLCLKAGLPAPTKLEKVKGIDFCEFPEWLTIEQQQALDKEGLSLLPRVHAEINRYSIIDRRNIKGGMK